MIATDTILNVNTQTPTEWRPADDDIDRIIASFNTFANARFGNSQNGAGYSFLGQALRAEISREEWIASSEEFIRYNGPMAASQILRIS